MAETFSGEDSRAPLISARGIDKVYTGGVQTRVLFEISLDIFPNQFTALIGPSGSGKSTLLNILGLLDGLTGGELWIDGTEASRLTGNEQARFRNVKLGFVFQFHHLLPEFTAVENILLPMRIGGRGPVPELVERAEELMRRIGIAGVRDKFPNQMSGGQQQRVAIARALIHHPPIILADEPTGNLDRSSGESVLELLREIVAENQSTLVMVTHDLEMALKSDRIIELVDGRICRDYRLNPGNSAQVRRDLNDNICTLSDSYSIERR